MTIATPTLKLKACPRCTGALALIYDMYGGFWDCTSCGFHSEADVPTEPRVRIARAVREYRATFVYAGPEDAFQGHQIRGRLLPRESSITTERFDIVCPYQNCTRRQRKMGSHAGTYTCKNRHIIYLNLVDLTWR